MGGSGKTTLARTLFQDTLIKDCFDICVWATISQEYSIREILKEVLGLKEDDGKNMSASDMGEKLHKYLEDT